MSLADRILRLRRGEVLTPLIDAYLREHRNLDFSPETWHFLRELGLRPPRERSESFSASSLGRCMRAHVLAHLGVEGDEFLPTELAAIFMNGHWLHLKWQGIMLELGIVRRVGGVPQLEVPVIVDEWQLRGTVDAIVELGGLPYLLDFKGVNPGSFTKAKNGEVSRFYRWQLHGYMRATGIPRAILLYENKASQAYHEVLLRAEDADAKGAQARALGLVRFLYTKTLPPLLPEYPGGECRDCPFRRRCPSYLAEEVYDDVPL